MVLVDLTTYLVAQGVAASGSIFYGIVPDTPDAMIALLEYGGLPDEPAMGTGTINLEYPSIQLVTRGVPNDYTGPRQKAQDVRTAFARVVNQALSGTSYKAIEAKQPVFFLKRDESYRVYFACNFGVTKVYTA